MSQELNTRIDKRSIKYDKLYIQNKLAWNMKIELEKLARGQQYHSAETPFHPRLYSFHGLPKK